MRLVESAVLRKGHRGLEALARATGEPAPKSLTVKEVEDVGSLSESQKLISARRQANALVVSVRRFFHDGWCHYVGAETLGEFREFGNIDSLCGSLRFDQKTNLELIAKFINSPARAPRKDWRSGRKRACVGTTAGQEEPHG
jgi:hypothetical protein